MPNDQLDALVIGRYVSGLQLCGQDDIVVKEEPKRKKHVARHLKSYKVTTVCSEIEKVIFNDPATIVIWKNGAKTIVKCQKDKGDVYNKEVGLALCCMKAMFGNDNTFNKVIAEFIKE